MTNEELVYLYKQGNKQALEKLIEGNKKIVYKLVNKYYTEGTNSIDKEDLIQEGYLGLITAANKYDFYNEKRAQFITYAVFWVIQKINKFVNVRNTAQETSLNAPIGDDDSTELQDYIEGVDYSFENIEDKLYNQQLRKELDQVMSECNTLMERDILKLHYGWDCNECFSYKDISELMSITKAKVRYTEDRALKKIRKNSWVREKAKEYYNWRYANRIYDIDSNINAMEFERRYLEDDKLIEYLDNVIEGGV